MAQGWDFVCTACGNTICAWDDGNPYYIDLIRMMEDDLPRSRCKVYVHHPDKLEWPIEGNDVPFLCLSCNHMFNVDSEKPRTTCTKCRSSEIVDCCGLGGRACHGIFEIDKGSWKIS